ncbi:MMPL family transporter [Williamsia maris]|uniref:Drug exporter of the RND superfamily n=1 Tax=Williamsia maris TaxID=72806 RepID=A0ABT1H879_9NOCA|nr:MMPL family transporter [Williamsia maris]MCP2174457.1 putative drug exporter of the RND superfamily [Williamsia maris]
MLSRLTKGVIAAPRRVLLVTLAILVVCGALGFGVGSALSAGGYSDPTSESARAGAQLGETFNRGGLQVVIALRLPTTGDISQDPTALGVAKQITDTLETETFVQQPVLSLWRNSDLAPALQSAEGSTGLIVFTVSGGERDGALHAQAIDDEFAGGRSGITVTVGGEALVYQQINDQTSRDLAIAEAIAIPISFCLLIWVFGGLVAAAIPVVIGLIAIIGAAAILRMMTLFTDVSVFALNLATALGLALAIDYTLLIISRYREELASGRKREDALIRTISTAGRTVLFSAATVGLSLCAMAIFPMYFLRSFAYAGIGVIIVAAAAALIVTPAILFALGDRVDALDVRRPIRRLLRKPPPAAIDPEDSAFYRSTKFVFRHHLVVGVSIIAFLLLLGAPFLGMKVGFPDERVLPTSASSFEIGAQLREDFPQNASVSITAVLPDVGGDAAANSAVAAYADTMSRIADVNGVTTAQAAFVDGQEFARGDPGASIDRAQFVTVATSLDPLSRAGSDQLDALRAVPTPGGTQVLFTGLAQQNRDNVDAIVDRLPLVLGLIAVTTFVLLFLLSGSVLLPLKALVLNAFSLSATFGAMVWIFQDGHLGGLGTTVTGSLAATMPVLMFCIAFGLSMDYEVFLLSRIREEWLRTGQATRADNEQAVAMGLARTGRVVTAAAVLMAIVFAGIIASQVSFMRMFGLGLMLAVLVDATLVRVLLVPAFMRLAGRANWWAPGPLRRFHDRFGLTESDGDDPDAAIDPAPAVPGRASTRLR